MKKHVGEEVESLGEAALDGAQTAVEQLGGLLFRIFLQHDVGDEALIERLQAVKAALDINDEQDHVLEGVHVVIANAGAEAFAAENGGQASDLD